MKLHKTLKVHDNCFLCNNLHKQQIQTTSLKERNKAIYIKLKGSIVIGFSPCWKYGSGYCMVQYHPART